MPARPKVVLLGMLTKIPVGGVAWLVGQYATGFERLGFETYYVEAHARTPSMFMEHEEDVAANGKAANYIAGVMRRFGLPDRWAFHALHDDGHCYGLRRTELERLYRDAAVIVNLHGGTEPRPEHAATGRLVYLGTDPVDVELELARDDDRAIAYLDAHTTFFTWGLNFGNPDCTLPWSERFPFVPSPAPVVADLWENAFDPSGAPFTTVGNWRQSYRDLRFEGELYRWSKHHEFLKVLDLPRRVDQPFELALSSYEETDRRRLEDHGWSVRPGLEVSADVDAYHDYLVGSRGEFSVAKDQNIRFRTGWFSERSATYLAAGRPVVVQDTGFGNYLPTGEGLFAFADVDGAAAAIEEINADYSRHSRAARSIAREFLDTSVVLVDLLDRVGIETPDRRARRVSEHRERSADLPEDLVLTPTSRRPIELDPETTARMLARPVPIASIRRPTQPDISIVMAVVDNLALTRMALESVLAHSADCSYEVVVVDNGSESDTRRYLSVLGARNAHLEVVRNEANRGFAAANNQAIARARGDVLVLLNNDTIVTPGWLSRLAGYARHPDVGLVGPVTNRCGNEAEVPARYDTYGALLAHAADARAAAATPFDIDVAVMFCAALRREVFDRVGPLDERFQGGMFEDDDYAVRARNAGFRIVCAQDVFVHHFGEASLGRLAANGRYSELFDANRRRFEAKWGTSWSPHRRRTSPEYLDLRARVMETVDRVVPPGAIAAVISRGDDRLLELSHVEGWHFPRLPDGTYAGHHPEDDRSAIAQLEQLRRDGAGYLVVPAPSMWWLEHYGGFTDYLDRKYRRTVSEPDLAVVYDLESSATP